MLQIDSDGTISIYQGDSGEFSINGLDEEQNCVVCLAVQDKNRKPVGQELQVSVNNFGSATFVFTPEFTDLLTVPLKKPYEIYYYGIKVCVEDSSVEDTLFIADGIFGDLNRIIVYPRKVKGVEDDAE